MTGRFLLSCIALCSVGVVSAWADNPSKDGTWTALDTMPAAEQAREALIRANRFQPARIDLAAMKNRLALAPMERTPEAVVPARITLPTPEGDFLQFDIIEYSMMEPGLAAQFPDIHTYLGQCVENPAANVHLDITMHGFRAQVLSPQGMWAVDPFSKNETTYYTSYYAKDLNNPGFQCFTEPDLAPAVAESPYSSRATGTTLRTYRLAMAACPSFTGLNGGTVASAQAAIVTGVNRINQVYGNEVCVRFTLIANNTSVIYTTTSPYTDGNLSTMLGQNQSNLASVIGSANYDIGHVLSGQNLGGLANLRALCSSTNKGRGGTGLASPTGDGFWVQYVSHELGHQCGANHTFNADDSAGGNVCSPNRNGGTAYEPGSGTTIMSYSHLCGTNNQVQTTGPDPMFNQSSYAEIAAHISGSGACSSNTSTGNTVPTVNAGADRSIPTNTPFAMTAAPVDVNGDSVTISWEERDLGPAQPETGTGSEDNGTSPLFRVFAPSASTTRTFPRMTEVISGLQVKGEQYPTVARTLRLRATARDNRAGGGGVNTDDVNLTVVATAAPFRVTSPNTNVTWSGNETVTWDVAGTTAAPFNVANVKISLSLSGGTDYTTLLESTPNTGSAQVSLPATEVSRCRIKVEAIGNYFFDISDVNFTVTANTGIPAPTNIAANPSTVCPGGSTVLSATVPPDQTIDWFTGSCGGTLIGTGPSIVVTPTVATTYRARARVLASNDVGSGCATQFVTIGVAPTITTDPDSASVIEGEPVAFSVNAGGSIPLSYQWRLNGSPLTNGGAILGATTSTLYVTPATAADAGNYDVVVSNSCGSDTSAVATLTVAPNCGTADFNGDGDFGTDADIESFFACLAGNCCATCYSGGADFNADGDVGTDADIESFFRVLGGGPC